jgi:hypothetical protein
VEKIVIAIITLIAGAVGGTVASLVNWGIEKRKQKLAYRRELVASWRKMIADAPGQLGTKIADTNELLAFFEGQQNYYSLRAHLTTDTRARLKQSILHMVLTPPSVGMPPTNQLLRLLSDEVARIEKEWELV